jgi:hypothetical protein
MIEATAAAARWETMSLHIRTSASARPHHAASKTTLTIVLSGAGGVEASYKCCRR